MSCLAVRRALLVDPERLAPAERDHLRGCAACCRVAAEVAARERLIAYALRVPLPPGLERRLLGLWRRRPIGSARGTRGTLLAGTASGETAVALARAPADHFPDPG
jgi:hypothetical protein